MLPPLPDEGPDARAKRELRAMDAVIALQPENEFEARLAVRIVAMDAHAADCLRLACLAVNDVAEMRRCQAQAGSMARQADATTRTLLRVQAVRGKQDAALHPPAMRQPVATPPAADEDPESTEAEMDAEVERYEIMYPDRAARIRAAGACRRTRLRSAGTMDRGRPAAPRWAAPEGIGSAG
ncbi:MAG TPA: hypothetical protein VFL55_07805 [Acetobacteraceae bacterium]|nr:hypothetical protein [Acetobacteraceae bacterium]